MVFLPLKLHCPALVVLLVVSMVTFRNGNFDLSSELAGVLPHNAHTSLPSFFFLQLPGTDLTLQPGYSGHRQ